MWIAPHSKPYLEQSSSPALLPVLSSRKLPSVLGRAITCVLGLLFVAASARAMELIRFSPPAFLTGPAISRAALGATYLYRGQESFAGTELRITVAREPPELDDSTPPSAALCLRVFEAELKRQFPDLFALPSGLRMSVGSHEFSQIRWSRQSNRQVITGVLACGVLRGHFVAINYGARSDLALRLFPAIRLKLSRLELNF